VAFGAGVHHCLGSHLARRELRVMIEEICALESFELCRGAEIHYRPAFARGPVSLPVRCSRAQSAVVRERDTAAS
jgi:cytochrome P450